MAPSRSLDERQKQPLARRIPPSAVYDAHTPSAASGPWEDRLRTLFPPRARCAADLWLPRARRAMGSAKPQIRRAPSTRARDGNDPSKTLPALAQCCRRQARCRWCFLADGTGPAARPLQPIAHGTATGFKTAPRAVASRGAAVPQAWAKRAVQRERPGERWLAAGAGQDVRGLLALSFPRGPKAEGGLVGFTPTTSVAAAVTRSRCARVFPGPPARMLHCSPIARRDNSMRKVRESYKC
ncbi:hypothetical protein BS50DRAFT_621628 [Corynespora cassiicola Philippines]|uniref:Uncharacterized protein n=1 Tax=Corynespora cassiicola Philippines TaxID=1448308 RepID=A0A2T2NKE0_CORCC|nr:hypothetical protein BS50DRAFT_621628 [Corynespora cassiicola Philippines]